MCPYAIYSLSFGPIWTLKVPMDFLGPGGGYKTVCRVMGPELKIFFIFKIPFFNSTTYLPFKSVCVFDQLFQPLSIKLFQIEAQIWNSWVKANLIKLFAKWWDQKGKKYYWRHLFWFYYLPSISSPFVCLINFFTPFPSSYFKSKHRFGLLGPRQR